MKYLISKYIYLLFLSSTIVWLSGCSSTQSSVYKPDDGGTGWKVNVTKKAAISDEFICTINDSVIVSASFPLIGDNFEKTGKYRGKKVMMNGFRKSSSTTSSDGKVTTSDSYQIRVFIDDKQVDKFDF